MVVTSRLEELGDLVQGEPQALGRLDHPQGGHRLFRVEPVASQASVGLGDDAAAFVVAQGLDVDPDRLGDLAGSRARSLIARAPALAWARAASAASTCLVRRLQSRRPWRPCRR